MRRSVNGYCLVAFVCFAAWQEAPGATLKGVLYGDQGGVSGTASGTIRLAVNGQVYHLAYQKPYPAIFSTENCRLSGSRWTIEAKVDDLGKGVVLSAQCRGGSDSLGLPAVQLVSQYLDFIRNQNYLPAYDLFASTYKSEHPFSEMAAQAAVLDFRMYLSAGQCLEIVRKISASEILVRAGSECFIGRVGEPAPLSFVFDVVRGSSSNSLRFGDVVPIVEQPRMVKRFPSETTRDTSIERAVRRVLQLAPNDYYFYNKVDLDGVGEPEVLVHVVSHARCDFNGCNLLVLQQKGAQYEVVSNITPTCMPVFVSTERTNGWRDLIVSGEAMYYTVLKFDGKSYPQDPRSQPPLRESVDATAYLSNPLKPAYGVSLMRDRRGALSGDSQSGAARTGGSASGR